MTPLACDEEGDRDDLRTPLLSDLPSTSEGEEHDSVDSPPHEQQQQQQQQQQKESLRVRDLAIMGALDSLATTMQIYAAVYLPGPLLILLPQAAVPLSLVVSLNRRRRRQQQQPETTYRWTQYVGATVVALGIVVLMGPHWANRLSPAYYCEAINVDNDCTICKLEFDEENCLSHISDPTDDDDNNGIGWMKETHNNAASLERLLWPSMKEWRPSVSTPDGSLCQWLPFEEATREEEILASIWSTVLIASCIPMILSTLYKEWAMERTEAVRRDYPIYLNGWIAVFQLFFSIPLAFLGGLVSTPTVQPEHVLQNLWYGLQCYMVGSPSVKSGCHPDALCGTMSFWLVNLHLVASLGYSYFMLFCLKYGSTTLFFLAVTLMVPCKLVGAVWVKLLRRLCHDCTLSHFRCLFIVGTAAFLLPFMPLAGTPCLSDFAGSIAIVIGLVLYRFFDRRKRSRGTNGGADAAPDEDDDDEFTAICRASFPWQRRNTSRSEEEDVSSSTSAVDTSLRTPLLSGDV